MVRHLLEEEHRTLGWSENLLPDHLLTVRVLCGKALFAEGVLRSRDTKEVCIQRLVDDLRIAALGKRVHQGRRDVPRTGPETDALHVLMHCSIGTPQ